MVELVKWHFSGDAEPMLSLKGIRGDLDAVGRALDGTDLADITVKRELEVRHWQTSVRVWEGANYNYDGFKDGVAVEAIGPGTSNGRAIVYGLVKMELGRHPGGVEIGVLIVSTKSHFVEAKEFTRRLRQSEILRIPIAILGIDAQRAYPKSRAKSV